MEIIGAFKFKITISYPDGSVNSDTGEPSGTWTTLASVWARRDSVKGRDGLLANKTISMGDEVFVIRYRTDVTPKMRVSYKGSNYEISSVEEMKINETLRIICQRLS